MEHVIGVRRITAKAWEDEFLSRGATVEVRSIDGSEYADVVIDKEHAGKLNYREIVKCVDARLEKLVWEEMARMGFVGKERY